MHWPPYEISMAGEKAILIEWKMPRCVIYVFFPFVSRIPHIWKKGRGVSTWRASSPTLNRRFRSTIRAQREIITITLQFDCCQHISNSCTVWNYPRKRAVLGQNRVVSLRWELKKRVSWNTLRLLIVDRNVFIALEQVDVLVLLLGDIITTDITVIAGRNVISR